MCLRVYARRVCALRPAWASGPDPLLAGPADAAAGAPDEKGHNVTEILQIAEQRIFEVHNQSSKKKIRHTRQDFLIVRAMILEGLLQGNLGFCSDSTAKSTISGTDTCFVEFGAGHGMLGLSAQWRISIRT